MRRIAIAFLLCCLWLFAGCSDTRIDGSSPESAKASIEKIQNSLSEEDKKEFASALIVVAMSGMTLAKMMANNKGDVGIFSREMLAKLDGKTAQEIISEANKIKEARKAEEQKQALIELKELEKKVTDADKAAKQLALFKVVRSRFYKQEQGFLVQPVIELTVKNDTPHPISRAYFNGRVASPNRAVPWIQEDFNYSIPGGVEPGEEVTWKLNPNMFSDWKADVPTDAVMTVKVKRLDGADGNILYDGSGLSEYEQERLKSLKEQFGAAK